jgi:hypothetical protein
LSSTKKPTTTSRKPTSIGTRRPWIWAADRLWAPQNPYDATEKSVVFAIVRLMREEGSQWAITTKHSTIAERAGCSVATVKRQLEEHLKRMPLIKIAPLQASWRRNPYGPSRYVLLCGVAQIELPGSLKMSQGVAQTELHRSMNRTGFVGGPIQREDGPHGTTE